MNEQLRADWREIESLRRATTRYLTRLTRTKTAVVRLAERDPQFDMVLAAAVRMQLEANSLDSLLRRLPVPPELVEEVL
jgi:hypothetical protein